MADPDASPVTVLVVEDDEEVRALACDVLELNGYAVLPAEDGEHAVRLGEGHPGPIHLLITDLVMPRMSGLEVARRLRASRPGLRVLCMSGYPERAGREAEGAGTWNAWLEKPFSPDGLMLKVRESLTS